MNLIFSMALRNGLRSWRRSLLTAAAITIGTALLNVGMCWVGGILSDSLDKAAAMAGHVRVVTTRYSEKESLFPLSENISDTAPLEKALATVPGVTGVYPRLQLPATVSVGEEVGEVFSLLQGAPEKYYQQILHLDQHLASGRMMTADSEAVMGVALAEEAKVKIDDTVIFIGQTQDGSISPIKVKVVGFADFGSRPQNKLVYLTLEKARYMADIADGATELLVFADDRNEAESLASRMEALPEMQKLEVRPWSKRKPWSEILSFIQPVISVFGGVIVMITGLVVLNTMLMSVLERTAEIGVLRALGMKRWETVQLFVVEAIGIAVIGGVLGALLGGIGSWYLVTYGVNMGAGVNKIPSAFPINTVIHGRFEYMNLVKGMVLSQVMAVIGSLLPALRAAAVQPIEAIRQRR